MKAKASSRLYLSPATGITAALAAALFIDLGLAVRHGEPPALAAWQASLVNHSTLVAWWLTWSCYIYVLAPIAVGLLLLAWLLPQWRARIIFSIVMLLLCWRGADLLQHLFARPRPFDWVVKHETAYSYPSSHAAIATGFYALWGAMLYTARPGRAALRIAGILLAIFTVAICWSRLALGAHYVTDVIGGALFAVALVATGLTVVPAAILGGAVGGRASRAVE
ncbi:MAG: phosphatase PAP2 family protein [Candidatus Eremiobacteraeota bacterium]|nr:phosphatase PAP2 family protein [Candidatus Eremiobacteraeota bacterium]